VLKRVLPMLRPEARKLIEKEGFVSQRIKVGLPMLRVVDGWCVFFNRVRAASDRRRGRRLISINVAVRFPIRTGRGQQLVHSPMGLQQKIGTCSV
jgi:hypothetical protein